VSEEFDAYEKIGEHYAATRRRSLNVHYADLSPESGPS